MKNPSPEPNQARDFNFSHGPRVVDFRKVSAIQVANPVAVTSFFAIQIITLLKFQAKTFSLWAGTQSPWVGPMLRSVSARLFSGPDPSVFDKSPKWEVGL